MKFAIACIASILTSTVYGLVPSITVRENVDLEERAGAPKACGDPRNAVPLLRAFQPGQVDHFYTTNAAEFQNAVTQLGYNDEGTAGYVFTSQQPHIVPLYRLFKGAIRDHFYTTNAAERDMQLITLGTPTKESPDTSIPTPLAVFYHCIDSTVVQGQTNSIPCLLQNATMPEDILKKVL